MNLVTRKTLEQRILVPICSWNHEMIWSWVVQHKHKCRICWPQDPSPPCTSPHSGSVHSLWGSIPENSISFAGTVDFFLGLKKMLCPKKILVRKKIVCHKKMWVNTTYVTGAQRILHICPYVTISLLQWNYTFPLCFGTLDPFIMNQIFFLKVLFPIFFHINLNHVINHFYSIQKLQWRFFPKV